VIPQAPPRIVSWLVVSAIMSVPLGPCHRAVARFGISGAFLVLECVVGGLVDPALVVFASSVSEYWNGIVA
jgi:hypothetical protein